MPKSHLRGEIIKIEHPEADGAVLLVRILIDCPLCGNSLIEVFGHHLHAIRDVIVEAIDRHPELTTETSSVTVMDRLRIAGSSTSTPENN